SLVGALCLIFAAGAGFGCWVSYAEGRSRGYLKGYDIGRKVGRQDAEAKISAIRHSAEQEVQAVKERGQAASAAIDYLYQGALAEVEQLDSDTVLPDETKPS